VTANPHHLVLDPVVQAFLESLDDPSDAGELGRDHAPAAVTALHGAAAGAVAEEWVTVDCGEFGAVPVCIVRAGDGGDPLPAVVYLHGSWSPGGAGTHRRLVAELAVKAGIAVVFPQLVLGTTGNHPVALEQAYATARWVSRRGDRHGLDPCRIGVAGDSFGGYLAIGSCLLSLRRGEFRFAQLIAFTPVTDTADDTSSCAQFADGYHLRRADLRSWWERYLPQRESTADATVAPLRADATELGGFPASLIITAEADVVRDQGEAFAARLREVGVPTTAVRYEGTIHGFTALDALYESSASRAATAQAAAALRAALHEGAPQA
jgi:acetyl esterase/lipase